MRKANRNPTGCWLDDTAPLLRAVDLAVLRLVGCWLPAGLRVDQIRTRSDVIFLRCCFLREVRLLGAHIGGQLVLAGAKLRNPGKYALTAERLQVDDSVSWRPASVLGGIDFKFAKVGIWADTKAAMSFPAALEGLQDDAISQGPSSLDVSARLEWLALDPFGYSPLPYVQLASVLRSSGDDRQAR
jgi:hypothetical protein